MGEAEGALRFIGGKPGAGLPDRALSVHWLGMEAWPWEPAFHAHWLRGGGRATRKASGDETAVMESASAGFRKELVSRLLHLHFKDDKTKGAGASKQRGGRSGCPWGAAGPGRRHGPGGCGPAGEGASSAAPGLLGVSASPRPPPGSQYSPASCCTPCGQKGLG
uniref:Centromere protein X isoform 3 n=1 Tax=Heterocephalus glaber TaxID=10181 RepID=A0A0P6K5R7_HETGA